MICFCHWVHRWSVSWLRSRKMCYMLSSIFFTGWVIFFFFHEYNVFWICPIVSLTRCDTIRQRWWVYMILSCSFSEKLTMMRRERSIRRKFCPRDQSLCQVREYESSPSLQFSLRPSVVLIYNIDARTSTPMSISFDVLSEESIPLKECLLWNRRTFILRIMTSATEERGQRITWRVSLWEWNESLRMSMFCSERLRYPSVPEHLRAIRRKSVLSTFSTRNNVRFLYWDPKYQNPSGPRTHETVS